MHVCALAESGFRSIVGGGCFPFFLTLQCLPAASVPLQWPQPNSCARELAADEVPHGRRAYRLPWHHGEQEDEDNFEGYYWPAAAVHHPREFRQFFFKPDSRVLTYTFTAEAQQAVPYCNEAFRD